MRRAAQRAVVARPDDPPSHRFVRADPYGYHHEAAVMRTEWRDPDDVTPNAAKSARTIRGFRTFCPLRRMLPFGAVTQQHVQAADKVRELWDVVRVGFSGAGNPLVLFVAVGPQPRSGPGGGEMRRVKAARELRRAVAPFSLPQQALIFAIILQNQSVRHYCQAQVGPKPRQSEIRHRLVAVLDRLAEHFDSEIEDEVARGRRLAP